MTKGKNIVDRLLADEPALLTSLDFGPFVKQGTGPGPSLIIGDLAEISLVSASHRSFLDYRMAHLARPGDIVLVQQRDTDFETYLQDHCGTRDVTFLDFDQPGDVPVAKQILETTSVFENLVDFTRTHGGLTIKPYLTTGSIWRLAQTIGDQAQCLVHVCGPSARVSDRANDKLWFTQMASTVIGADAVPPTMSAYGPDAAAGIAAHLISKGQQVIIKVPDSAGSAGNLRLDIDALAHQPVDQIKSLLLDRLTAAGWHDSYPILVGVWDANVTCSPSVQMWIPRPDGGAPRALGVFEQRVLGDTAAFVGAVASTLPSDIQDRLVDEALRIARVLQQLGFYGSCSLDAVICDQNMIHWIECNGRWSGVSIPLAILERMMPGRPPEGILILQEKFPGDGFETSQAVSALDDILTAGDKTQQGVVLLSPPSSALGATANLLVYAPTQSHANWLGGHAIELLKTIA